jgi:hypothetical protein
VKWALEKGNRQVETEVEELKDQLAEATLGSG